jgi:hypothetical protein
VEEIRPQPRSSRRWLKIIASGAALGLAGVLAGYLLDRSEPALVAGLQGSWDARNSELVERVARQFPPGTPAAALRAELARQGFKVAVDRAQWEQSNFPCRDFAEIRWQAEGGRIVSTNASIFQACT